MPKRPEKHLAGFTRFWFIPQWFRALFAWRTLYENGSWELFVNDVTGARRWLRKVNGYSPRPMVDDNGQVIPMLGKPPARPTR